MHHREHTNRFNWFKFVNGFQQSEARCKSDFKWTDSDNSAKIIGKINSSGVEGKKYLNVMEFLQIKLEEKNVKYMH